MIPPHGSGFCVVQLSHINMDTLAQKATTELLKAFGEKLKMNTIPATVAQWFFGASPRKIQYPLSFHPESVTSAVLGRVMNAPPALYLCAEPSGCGKSSTFQIAAAKSNGLKYIASDELREAGGGYKQAFLASLNVPQGQFSMFSNFFTLLLLTYSRCVEGGSQLVQTNLLRKPSRGPS